MRCNRKEVDVHDMKAIYTTIYQDLLDRIQTGEYPYQSLIPSESVLTGRYGCSHNTLRRALGLLAQQGYVQPINGKGVRVIYQPHTRTRFEAGGIETFAEAARRCHLSARTEVATFERITCSRQLATRSSFTEGDRLVHIDRVRVLDGTPTILDRNYFREDLVPGLTPAIAAASIFDYIEHTLGMRIVTSKRTITAEKATQADRAYLDLDGFDFVTVMCSQTFNGDGIMFEYTQSRHRPDGFSFSAVARRKT